MPDSPAPPGPNNTVPAAVHLAGVYKSFNAKPALTDLSVVAPKGKITVLLGPNGAGKTTAIRCITGAMTPDQGVVRTLDLDPADHGETVRSRCGIVSAKPALYDRLSGWDNLTYAAELHGVNRATMRNNIFEAAARFGIDHALDDQVGGYSTGMKTRLALSRSVLHDPELLLFDEPTSGLDPESAQAVLQLIREMTNEGRTVVMCTHHLVEAEGLADHVIVLDVGTDLVAGRPDELTRTYWPEDSILLAIAGGPEPLTALANSDGVDRIDDVASTEGVSSARVVLQHADVGPRLVTKLVEAGAQVLKVAPHEPSLEDLYFAVRREAREARGYGSSEGDVLPPTERVAS